MCIDVKGDNVGREKEGVHVCKHLGKQRKVMMASEKGTVLTGKGPNWSILEPGSKVCLSCKRSGNNQSGLAMTVVQAGYQTTLSLD